MIFDEILQAVSDVTPQFNKSALKDFVKEHIDNSPEFIALVLREGFKFVNRGIELIDYTVLSPEEQVKFELRSSPSKTTRPRIPLTVSHFRLVRYKSRFQDNYVYSTVYTPYMYDDMLFNYDKRSVVRKVILEKTFARVQDKDKDGLSISPIRVNITINRRRTFRIQSFVTGEFYSQFLVSSRLFSGDISNKICEATIVHYFLAKFGFSKTLKKFGLTRSDVSFVTEVGTDTKAYEYFAAKPWNDKSQLTPQLFLRVKKTVLANDHSLRFVVNLLYVLNFFDIQNIDNVYVDEGSIWKVILGFILFSDRIENKAYSNAQVHLQSVDTFIDPLTRDRFCTFGIAIDDIYDLLLYTFSNIDSFMVNNQSQDIYNSRIDVANGILVETFGRKIFRQNIYQLNKRSNLTLRDVEQALQLNPMMFKLPSSNKRDDSEHYIAPPEIVGDNFLFGGGLNKIRLGGKVEQRLHPSMLVTESIDAFVGKYIGKTGYLNPFIPTDEHGAIQRPDYTASIDAIMPYLPR